METGDVKSKLSPYAAKDFRNLFFLDVLLVFLIIFLTPRTDISLGYPMLSFAPFGTAYFLFLNKRLSPKLLLPVIISYSFYVNIFLAKDFEGFIFIYVWVVVAIIAGANLFAQLKENIDRALLYALETLVVIAILVQFMWDMHVPRYFETISFRQILFCVLLPIGVRTLVLVVIDLLPQKISEKLNAIDDEVEIKKEAKAPRRYAQVGCLVFCILACNLLVIDGGMFNLSFPLGIGKGLILTSSKGLFLTVIRFVISICWFIFAQYALARSVIKFVSRKVVVALLGGMSALWGFLALYYSLGSAQILIGLFYSVISVASFIFLALYFSHFEENQITSNMNAQSHALAGSFAFSLLLVLCVVFI